MVQLNGYLPMKLDTLRIKNKKKHLYDITLKPKITKYIV
jgi:hypothetical protein